jgi:hypothetical protein
VIASGLAAGRGPAGRRQDGRPAANQDFPVCALPRKIIGALDSGAPAKPKGGHMEDDLTTHPCEATV